MHQRLLKAEKCPDTSGTSQPERHLPKSLSDAEVRQALAEIRNIRCHAQHFDHAFFHPFPARMPFPIAHFLIERLSVPGDIVLDPMVGSGTTLIAAKKSGRVGLGFDLDPLAVMLSRAAVATADMDVLQAAHDRVLAQAREWLQRPRSAVIQMMSMFDEEEKAFLNYWFPEQSQRELFALMSAIQEEQNEIVREFLWAVFSSLIIAKSSGASYALDIAHSRPHRRLDKTIVSPLEAWTPRFQRAVRKLAFRASADGYGKTEVQLGDARHLTLKDSTVDLVLTSPPYLQAIDYIRAHKFTLIWMGHDLERLRQIRSTMIGTERGMTSPNGLPASIEKNLTGIPSPSPRQGRVRRYISDLHGVLTETHRVLKPGALAVFAVGPSLISRTRYDATDILEELAQTVGLEVVGSVTRRLEDRRRALPPPRRIQGQNDLNKRMRAEMFVAMRKLTFMSQRETRGEDNVSVEGVR